MFQQADWVGNKIMKGEIDISKRASAPPFYFILFYFGLYYIKFIFVEIKGKYFLIWSIHFKKNIFSLGHS